MDRVGWFQALFQGNKLLALFDRSELYYYGDGIGGFTTALRFPPSNGLGGPILPEGACTLTQYRAAKLIMESSAFLVIREPTRLSMAEMNQTIETLFLHGIMKEKNDA